jgi:hypothetical protein
MLHELRDSEDVAADIIGCVFSQEQSFFTSGHSSREPKAAETLVLI